MYYDLQACEQLVALPRAVVAAFSLELIRCFRYYRRVQQLSVARKLCLVLWHGMCIVQGSVGIINKAVAHCI